MPVTRIRFLSGHLMNVLVGALNRTDTSVLPSLNHSLKLHSRLVAKLHFFKNSERNAN